FIEADMAAVVAGAVRVLDTIGVQCTSPVVRDRLLRVAGVRANKDRLYLAPSLGTALLAEFREPATGNVLPPAPAEPGFRLAGPWCALLRADGLTGQVAPATTVQVAEAIRLLEGLNVTVGVAPLEAAADTPPALRNLAGLRAVLLHSKAGANLTNLPAPNQREAVAAMSAAAGRTASAFLVPLISPLKFECTALEALLSLPAKPGFHLHLAAGMPAVGSTAPLDVPGALMQSLAETLAVQACAKAFDRPYSLAPVRIDPFDLRYANYVVGSPEFGLFDMASRALHLHLSGQLPERGAFRSMAKQPDAQAQHERSTNLLFQALQGARRISAVGQLSLDEVFSPEQAVLDVEIARSVERFVLGVPWNTAAEGSIDTAVGYIARGVTEGQYLDAPETLNRYRAAFHHSTLFRYENVQTWERRGSIPVLSAAAERAKQVVAETPACRLTPDAARDIDRIFTRAAQA
ncbi:MAG TPA: trimethylamine methyltransferase family protein, partial [Planctomycetota bacterium]|nr:trimethylamine methyltransferase family protein [Planctomycetota bacterium]